MVKFVNLTPSAEGPSPCQASGLVARRLEKEREQH